MAKCDINDFSHLQQNAKSPIMVSLCEYPESEAVTYFSYCNDYISKNHPAYLIYNAKSGDFRAYSLGFT